jgi:DNA-binding CsgD family transcriptional regulator
LKAQSEDIKLITNSLQPPDFTRAAKEKRANPGIIVLTHQGQLLYMNREADELCAVMIQADRGQAAKDVLPTEVINLCRNIADLMLVVTSVKDWENRHLRRVCEIFTHPVLLRGFGIPGPVGDIQALIIIMLERIASRDPVPMSQVSARFGLTRRGQDVVQYLAQGYTNKKIAQRIGITEQTVKEHMQRLMWKTKTTSRTELLARLFLQ